MVKSATKTAVKRLRQLLQPETRQRQKLHARQLSQLSTELM